MKKCKKIISLLLALLMALSVFTIVPFTASAAEAELIGTGEQDGFYNYTILADGSAEITKYFGTDDHVVVPATLGGHTVTVIGQSAFSGSEDMTSVDIPNTVTCIKLLAFSDCTGLTSITVPDSVTIIDDSVFENCINLAEINLPDTLTYLGAYVCSNTKWSNNQPAGSIVYLGNYAYRYEYDWYSEPPEDLVLREGTIGIADYAFRESDKYKSITLPDSLRFIGEDAFINCYNVKKINFGNSITEIQRMAFKGCDSLTNITFPDSLTRIGENAFYYCSKLGIINIPDSVVSIGEDAFEGTAWYDGQPDETLVYAGKVAYSYKGRNMPGEIILKPDTLGIADSAFESFIHTNKIILPNSLKHIGARAFKLCRAETGGIPDSVTSIGEAAFVSSSFPESVTIPKSVKRIEDYAFGYYGSGVSYLKDDDFTIYGYSGTDAERYAKENGFKFNDLSAQSPVILGDADGDGEVTILDATAIQRHIAELPTQSFNKTAADADEDGEVTILDATSIQRHIAELPTNKNIGKPVK